MSELDVLGTHCLNLLSDEATVCVLVCLRGQAISAAEIQEANPGLGYGVVRSRLRKLVQCGLVEQPDHGRPRSGGAHRASLTPAGLAIQTVIDAAAACEADWIIRTDSFGPPGIKVLQFASDRRFKAIARLLAHGSLRAHDLGNRIPGVSHGTLERRLRHGRDAGLILASKEGREAWHTLTDSGRRMASVALYAARWEWTFGECDKGLLASDLAGVIHQLAPLTRIPKEINGICLLREEWHTTLRSEIYLAAGRGRLTGLVLSPLEQDMVARGTPKLWAQALVTGKPAGITTTGDETLLAAVIDGFSREIRV
jgi:DNA-binding HxlR family transcriptional regulator